MLIRWLVLESDVGLERAEDLQSFCEHTSHAELLDRHDGGA
jgi:hypothetical protein